MAALKRFKSLFHFSICLAMLWGVVYFVPLAISKLAVYREFRYQLENKSVEPTALFYTEEQHTVEAAWVLEKRLKSAANSKDAE